MALAYDQQTVVARASGVDSLAMSSGQAVDAGDLLVVCSAVFNTSGMGVTVSGSLNGTYTQAAQEDVGDSNSIVNIHYFQNSAAGTETVTVNPTGSSADIDFTFSEVSGAKTSGALAGTNTHPPDGTGTSESVAVTGLDSGNYIGFGVMSHDGANNGGMTAGQTLIAENENNSSGQAYNAQYQIANGVTSVTMSWTLSASRNSFSCAAVFAEAVAGQDIPELRGRPMGLHGQRQLTQLLAR